ncbi:divergent polysaccharide deacetylase family protein [Candidatus Omnitrophota bacterium]
MKITIHYRPVLLIAITLMVIGLVLLIIRPKRVPEIELVEEEVVYEKRRPVVALVLDDMGYNRKNLEAIGNIGVPVTMAVLPDTPYSKKICSFADENGIEVILHMPMEPEKKEVNLERNTIGSEMDPETIKQKIDHAFKTVPAAKGMNNHMGSKATRNGEFMTLVLGELDKRGMFFLDSWTAGGSKCLQAARKTGVPYAKRDVFIDNKRDRQAIIEQMEKVERIAFQNGKAVAIGHDRVLTVQVLREVIPGMEERGIQFVSLSEIVERQE